MTALSVDWAARMEEHWQRAVDLAKRAETYLLSPASPDTARARAASDIAMVHSHLARLAAGALAEFSAMPARFTSECSCRAVREEIEGAGWSWSMVQHSDDPCPVHPERPFMEVARA